MAGLARNWRVILLVFFLMLSFLIIAGRGLQFGIDFSGGTLFQVQLAEPITDAGERSRVVTTIQQRLDWTGLRDTTVNFFGDQFVIAQVAETDPGTVERIEGLLKKQGVFEATIDGNVIFTGEDIIELPKDPAKGYGLYRESDGIRWVLPFVLRSNAALRFTELTFHRCELISYSPETGREYECEKTYFFIDRPKKSVLVLTRGIYYNDEQLLLEGSAIAGIPLGTKIKEVLLNANAPYFVLEESRFSDSQLEELRSLVLEKGTAVVPQTLDGPLKQQLTEIGFELREMPVSDSKPWVFDAAGLRSIIGLSEGVAQMDVARLEDAQPMDKLQIFGFAGTLQDAEQRRSDLEILLQSGSLSVSVRSISKETISPLLGENFLQNAVFMGVLALLIVAVVLFLRYRVLKLTFPMIGIGLSEVIMTAAFASLISKFDLGAVAGIVAAVGTGVDNQIVITDELIRGEGSDSGSLFSRAKRAFFIVTAAACTTLATMLPIILIGFGLGRLVGFAITTTIGVLVGVLIARPAFAEIAKAILEKK
ncbi:MAG: hypothetical protein JW744_02845 [Candidatus Diapherotrites archaeon]|uniref:Protein export membrane protein SecD/SecF C-terminal domain-containing protein n=1 Tax=Candidatus Iainarchaeum sp. TaxID=3101447 RepID=A0A939C4N1_9ARCH|nr:hypothetical protein [Candidatus Diapherotrites archaeon]